MNGVTVNVAVTSFNSYRTQGITGYPGVAAVQWNDTLSNAAYNYAVAKANDGNASSNVYTLSSGQMILDFPALLYYSKQANFALFYGYPASTDVKTVIAAGFSPSNDAIILQGLMNSNAKQFGMAQYDDKWFLIMSN